MSNSSLMQKEEADSIKPVLAMTHITGTLKKINPVPNLKQRILLALTENTEVTIKKKNRPRYSCQSTSCVYSTDSFHEEMLHQVSASA